MSAIASMKELMKELIGKQLPYRDNTTSFNIVFILYSSFLYNTSNMSFSRCPTRNYSNRWNEKVNNGVVCVLFTFCFVRCHYEIVHGVLECSG